MRASSINGGEEVIVVVVMMTVIATAKMTAGAINVSLLT
jgi:hypothetical protein